MAWEIILHAEVHAWFLDLCKNDPPAAEKVEEALDELALQGPKLGRPLVPLACPSQPEGAAPPCAR